MNWYVNLILTNVCPCVYIFVLVCHHSSDQVFGCRLEMLCEREQSTIPRFVRLCTEAVEKRGTTAANTQVIHKLESETPSKLPLLLSSE